MKKMAYRSRRNILLNNVLWGTAFVIAYLGMITLAYFQF